MQEILVDSPRLQVHDGKDDHDGRRGKESSSLDLASGAGIAGRSDGDGRVTSRSGRVGGRAAIATGADGSVGCNGDWDDSGGQSARGAAVSTRADWDSGRASRSFRWASVSTRANWRRADWGGWAAWRAAVSAGADWARRRGGDSNVGGNAASGDLVRGVGGSDVGDGLGESSTLRGDPDGGRDGDIVGIVLGNLSWWAALTARADRSLSGDRDWRAARSTRADWGLASGGRNRWASVTAWADGRRGLLRDNDGGGIGIDTSGGDGRGGINGLSALGGGRWLVLVGAWDDDGLGDVLSISLLGASITLLGHNLGRIDSGASSVGSWSTIARDLSGSMGRDSLGRRGLTISNFRSAGWDTRNGAEATAVGESWDGCSLAFALGALGRGAGAVSWGSRRTASVCTGGRSGGGRRRGTVSVSIVIGSRSRGRRVTISIVVRAGVRTRRWVAISIRWDGVRLVIGINRSSRRHSGRGRARCGRSGCSYWGDRRSRGGGRRSRVTTWDIGIGSRDLRSGLWAGRSASVIGRRSLWGRGSASISVRWGRAGSRRSLSIVRWRSLRAGGRTRGRRVSVGIRRGRAWA
ncbi:hypothetical protein ABW21_db0205122 [Orbilia brochopaga]|nr:hypothetical protein ABW21_db0205122 [Drechslerella brochopaga]